MQPTNVIKLNYHRSDTQVGELHDSANLATLLCDTSRVPLHAVLLVKSVKNTVLLDVHAAACHLPLCYGRPAPL